MSVIASSVDCLFHENPSITLDSTLDNSGHDSFGDLSDIDFTIDVDETVSADSSCSTQLIAAALVAYSDTDEISWSQAYLRASNNDRLISVLLSQDIRPPIPFLFIG
ncbi:MAG: hypothetical protein OEX19_17320 [Gammaproteobacteria bacterium]|nr:hypothetical protein [Gammaproteobacteria bacterium]